MVIQVFYFKTNWCEICKKIGPYYNWISQRFKEKEPNKIEFLVGTLDNRKDLEKRFKIKEYPTFLIFADNKEIYRQEDGNLAKLFQKINELFI